MTITQAEIDDLRRKAAAPGYDPYVVRQYLSRGMNYLRDAEDYARLRAPGLPLADRIKGVYEQLTEDVLEGKTNIPSRQELLDDHKAQAERIEKLETLLRKALIVLEYVVVEAYLHPDEDDVREQIRAALGETEEGTNA